MHPYTALCVQEDAGHASLEGSDTSSVGLALGTPGPPSLDSKAVY